MLEHLTEFFTVDFRPCLRNDDIPLNKVRPQLLILIHVLLCQEIIDSFTKFIPFKVLLIFFPHRHKLFPSSHLRFYLDGLHIVDSFLYSSKTIKNP